MKKSFRNIMVGLLGTSLGVYLMAAPLATTVYANGYQAPSSYNNNGEMASQNKSRQIQNEKIGNRNQNPVEVVKAEASKIGFDAKNDTFTLINQTDSTAVVQVMHDGAKHSVTLKRSQQDQSYNQKPGRNEKDKQKQDGTQKQDRNEKDNPKQEHTQKQDKDRNNDRNQTQSHGQRTGQWIIVSVD